MKPTITLILFLAFAIVQAQTMDHYIIAAQGDESRGNQMTLSWTIGDLVTETSVFNHSVMTQGFQQPTIEIREIGSENPVTTNPSSDLGAQVFPNPFGTEITVTVENAAEGYFLEIYNLTGNLLTRTQSINPQEVINMTNYPVTQYILRIGLLDSGESKVF